MFAIIWLEFFISIMVLLLVSRKSLGIALISAAFVLGFFTLSPEDIWVAILSTLTNSSVILLSLAIGIIPLIGGVLKESGMLDDLLHNLRIGKKSFLMLSPALVGLLPMPGGALLSAPLVEKVGKNIKAELKAGINIWFRHILFLVYPLNTALIVSAKLAGLQVYELIPYLAPLFFFTILLGYFSFVRKIKGKLTYDGKISLNIIEK